MSKYRLPITIRFIENTITLRVHDDECVIKNKHMWIYQNIINNTTL